MSQMFELAGSLLLTSEEVAVRLKISGKTVEQLRRDGRGPPFVRIGPACVRYRLADLDAYIRGRVCGCQQAYVCCGRSS